MSIHLSKHIKGSSIKCLALSLLALLTISIEHVMAEPYLAVQTGQACSTCHVNPTGGGARNAYGSYFGNQELPVNPGSKTLFDPGILGESLRIGADLRANFNYDDTDEEEESQGFETQSGQLYFHLKPKDSRFSLYIDQQIAPGSAVSREAFILFNFSQNHYLKAGKIFLPYGLRLEDDSSFVRETTQFNFDNSDNGIELGLNYSKLNLNFALTNGTSATTNDDNRLQFVSRMEYLNQHWRVGANVALNNSELGDRLTSGLYAGINLKGFVILAEVDAIEDESIQNSEGDDLEQLVTLLEINRLIKKGLNVKLSHEWLDPDTNIDNNDRTRTSAIVEYTPYANIQLRGGVRVGDDIPQRSEGNFTQGFMQLHLYF